MVTAQEDDLQLASGCFTMLTDALALIVDPTTASIAEQSHLASLYPAQRPYRLSYAQWDVLADKLVELKMQYNVYSNPQLELDAAAVKVTLKPGYLAIIGLRPESHTLFAARQPHPGRYRVLRSLRNSMEHAPSH